MPDSTIWLGTFGLLIITIAMVGLWRRQLVAVWVIRREEQPELYWAGFAFQLGLGLVGLANAVDEWASAVNIW